MKNIYRKSLFTLLAFIISIQAYAQELKLRGRVIDKQTEEPISFATITVIGGKLSTHTDDNGNFNITVPSANAKVRVSYVGYQSQVLPLDGNNTTFDIALNPENTIEEVVIKRPKLKYFIIKIIQR